MKRILLFSPLVILALIVSCSKEDPFEKEKKEMAERIGDVKLDAYKAFKVAVRGTANTGKDTAFDRARMAVLAAIGYTLAGATDSTMTKDPLKVLEASKDVASSVAALSNTDEDSLPTVMENIDYVFSLSAGQAGAGQRTGISDILNESEEHLLLAGTWLSTAGMPSEMPLYEFSRTNDDQLRNTDIKLIAKAGRALLYLKEGWPYHAEKAADELIALTEKEKDYLLKNPWPAVDGKGNPVTPEQAWHQLHGAGYMLRGLAREKMEGREEDALDDLESFVKEAEAGGLDNEATWSVGAYLAIKREKKDDALKYLDKLAASKLLSKDELEAVKQTRDYIANRENDKALNSFSDKLAIAKIAGGYFGHLIMNSKPVKDMDKTPAGKEFMRMTRTPFGDSDIFPDVNTDSLMNQGKSLLDKVF